jgi:isopentenyl-diphosphate delta-isomerase
MVGGHIITPDKNMTDNCQLHSTGSSNIGSQKKLILVDKSDNPIDESEKLEAHQKGLLHRAFSLFVFNKDGEMLLQQRAKEKYHSGGLWSNAVCSHPRPKKNIFDEVQKRSQEEMGFICEKLEKVFPLYYKSEYENGLCEHEITHIFFGNYDKNPILNPEEVMNYKWLNLEKVQEEIKKFPENFTTWFRIILQNKKFEDAVENFLLKQKKSRLRKHFRHLRQNISLSEKKIFSQKITDHLAEIFSHQKISEKKYIALFAGTDEEPDLVGNANLRSLQKEESHLHFFQKKFPEKKFCFPKISADKRSMDFFEVSTQDDLEKGVFGILEPKISCKKVATEEIEIFCIPALAIDKTGIRLGMGGGFYDRYLSKLSPETQKIGVVFSCQISEQNLPKEDFDIGMDMIVSEREEIITPNYRSVF